MSKKSEKWIDLKNLPTKNGKIDWKNSIGHSCKFNYENIEGMVLIVKMCEDHTKLIVSYNNLENEILIDSFRNCKLAYVVGLKFNNYIYNIGDKIITTLGEITITNQTRKNNHRYYECICEHGHTFQKSESRMDSCPYCSGRNAIRGETDIETTNVDMFNMLLNKDYGYTHKQNSNIKTDWICPTCNTIIKNKTPNQIYVHGLGCTSCSDGISYNEKFIFNLMNLLSKNVITQYSKTHADWCGSYKYDTFFIDDNSSYIIECNGLQHYCENSNFRMSLSEVKQNDLDKELLANNYVNKYIVLDCRYSTLNWIKKSIMNSPLPLILNFKESDIDWKSIHRQSLKSCLSPICELWNKGYKISDIEKVLQINANSIARYLKNGTILGLCDYDADENKLLSYEKLKTYNTENRSNPIVCNETNMIFKSTYLCEELSEELFGKKLDHRNIYSVLKGKRHHTGNKTFQYITREEFNISKHQSPELAFGDYFISTEEPKGDTNK